MPYRYPSVRGFGLRYLIASLLPISGAALVVYTAVQLAVANANGTVPPPARLAPHSSQSSQSSQDPGPH
jgi:hypothetical protein